MLSCSRLPWHAVSRALVKRQIVCVSALDFLFGGGRRQHDLQKARGREERTGSGFEGTAFRNEPWRFSKPHPPPPKCLPLCNAGQQTAKEKEYMAQVSSATSHALGVPGEEGPSCADPLLSGKIPACVDFWTCHSVAADMTSFCCHSSMVTSPGSHCRVLGAGSDVVGTTQEMWQQL